MVQKGLMSLDELRRATEQLPGALPAQQEDIIMLQCMIGQQQYRSSFSHPLLLNHYGTIPQYWQ
jgi:hypothetical protein